MKQHGLGEPRAGDLLFMWAAVKTRVGSPSVADLEADGWEIVYRHPWYSSVLMRKVVAGLLTAAHDDEKKEARG